MLLLFYEENMEVKNNNLKEKFNKNYFILISFLLSSLGVFLFYLFGNMICDDYIVLRSDMLSGVIGGIKESCRNILTGNNIWFSFSTCLGVNNSVSIASSLFSPFNVIYLILYKVDENIVTAIVILLKVGCIAASFNYFCVKVLKNSTFSSVIISVFYSLCAYTIAYGTILIFWLDAMLIIPLLCCAIYDCINNDKRILLIFLYVYLFVSNFQMAYMVGIFSFVVVILYSFILYDSSINIKEKIKKIFNWGLSVVIAILISAIVWTPTLFFLLANRSEDSTSALEISSSLLIILNSLFWGNGYGIQGTYSYIYCGVPVLLLVPLYFMNNGVLKKEKIFACILLAFFAICTIITPLNMFMHAFDQPDSFWYRYSFIISFLLCSISARHLSLIRNVDYKKLFIIFSAWVLLYIVEQQVMPIWAVDPGYSPKQNSNVNLLINIVFLLGWILIYYLYNKFNRKIIFLILASFLAMIEIVSSTINETSTKQESIDYYDWYNLMYEATNEIKKDNDLYRVIVNNNRFVNSDSWFGFNGFSDLGSSEKYSLRKFLSNVGFATSPRFIDDGGHTPVSEMLLGVKYNINLPSRVIEFEDEQDMNYDLLTSNEKYLGVGYLVDGETILYEYKGRNAFENMNELVKLMTGLNEDCFVKVPNNNISYDLIEMEQKEYSDGSGKLKRTDDAGRFYITVQNNDYSKVYVQFETPVVGNYGLDYYIMGARNFSETSFNNVEFNTTSEMYYNEEKNKYNIFLSSEEGYSPESMVYNAINIYALDESAFNNQYEILKDGSYIIEDWSNGHLKGRIRSNGEKNILFLSIPYDPGWVANIDGKETEVVRLVDGTFMGVILPGEGDYIVTFDYICPGFSIGKALSLGGLLAFLAVIFEKKLKKKKA